MKIKLYILFILSISFLSDVVIAQQDVPGLDWKRTLGGKKSEKAFDVISTFDGNILIVGETTSPPAKGKDGFIIQLDPYGNKIFEKTFGGKKNDVLKSAIQTSEGNFILAGYSRDTSGHGKKDGWLIKVDKQGDVIWENFYGGPGNDEFESIRETPDGNFAVVGYYDHRKNKEDLWIFKGDADGEKIWQRSFGDIGLDKGKDFTLTPEGGFAIAGITSRGRGSQNIWCFILDKDGYPLYHQIFGTRQWENIEAITSTQDGGYALVGIAKTNLKNKGKGLKDMWLIKTAFDGEKLWERTYGGSGNDFAYDLCETADKGFILIGSTFSHLMGANTSKAMILKTDENGKILWEYDPIGGRANDRLFSIVAMQDGSYVLAGVTNSKQESAKKNDFWVIKLHADFKIDNRIGSKLFIKKIQLKGKDAPAVLEEGEETFILVEIENEGIHNVYDIDLIIDEITSFNHISIDTYHKIGHIAPGITKSIRIPLKGEDSLSVKDVVMGIGYTDASRTRSPLKEFKFSTKPIIVPSDYLEMKWVYPQVSEYADSIKVIKEKNISIKVIAKSDRPLKRKHFSILVDGQLYDSGSKSGEADLKAKSKNKGLHTYTYSNEISLGIGIHTVEVVVNNGSNEAKSGAIKIEYSNKSNIHIIAVGIEHDDLNFTTNDAKDFAASFKNQEGRLFDKVFLTTLISGQNTKAGLIQTNGALVKKAFRDLQDKYNYTIYEQDLLLVFISSHGRSINNKFKIIPSDFEVLGESVLIDYRKDIIEQVEDIPCNKLMFVDACQSGTIGEDLVGIGINEEESTLEKERSVALAKLNTLYKNTNTIASSAANQSSWEDPNWQNGAFTEAIIGAFKNEPYDDGDGTFFPSSDNSIITFGELFKYISRRVPAMVKRAEKNGTQNPFINKNQLMEIKDFPIYEIDQSSPRQSRGSEK